MKQVLIPAALCLALFACNNSSDKTTTKTTDTAAVTIPKDTTPPAANTPGENAAKEITYSRDKADLHEYLKVQQLGKDKIAYEISMVNGSCPGFKFKGEAKIKNGDSESDDDGNGNAYDVDEYVDDANGKCAVYIRIGADKGFTNRARFQVAECDSQKPCKDKLASETLMAQ